VRDKITRTQWLGWEETDVGRLIYVTNGSLDGYIEDANGSFDWSEPDDEVHRYYNEMMLGVGTQLLGRRMYETMAVWETDPAFAAESEVQAEFAAAWIDSDKVVYSTTLADTFTGRTRLARAFDPDEVRVLKERTDGLLLTGGPTLTAHALRAGVVDEIRIMILPVAVGAGKPALPTDLAIDLELIDERRFASGAVSVSYQVVGSTRRDP
jgi:dihydrofolate reductase